MCDILYIADILTVGIGLSIAYLALPKYMLRDRIAEVYLEIIKELNEKGIQEQFRGDTALDAIERFGKNEPVESDWKNKFAGKLYHKIYRQGHERKLVVSILMMCIIVLVTVFVFRRYHVCSWIFGNLENMLFFPAIAAIIIPSVIAAIASQCRNNAIGSLRWWEETLDTAWKNKQFEAGKGGVRETGEALKRKKASGQALRGSGGRTEGANRRMR